mgnify:CR=1 FL=1
MNLELLTALHERLPQYLGGHIALSVSALAVAAAVSLPLGVLAARSERVAAPVLTVAAVMQTIPNLALLALMVTVLGGRIGFWPAFVALTLYAVLPIVRNTIVGLQSVPAPVREAAQGLGMSRVQMLLRVEAPLAAPTIIAGLRTATVWVVGAATLATPVGADSLGNYIFTGLQLQIWEWVLFGCLFAAGFAILLDQAMRAVDVSVREKQARPGLIALAAVILLPTGLILSAPGGERSAGAAATADDRLWPDGVSRDLIVGAKGFAEQNILSRLIADELTAAGARVDVRESLGSAFAFQALRTGQIDVMVDYTGTIWDVYMERPAPVPRAQMFIEACHWLQSNHSVTCLGRLGFENAYEIAVRSAFAEAHGLETISDLNSVDVFRLGYDNEFPQRPEAERLFDRYGLDQRRDTEIEPGLRYQAARQGGIDAFLAFGTDAQLISDEFQILRDDQGAFPAYDAVVLLSERAASIPAVVQALEPLMGRIDARLMIEANAVMVIEQRSAREAAQRLRGDLFPEAADAQE